MKHGATLSARRAFLIVALNWSTLLAAGTVRAQPAAKIHRIGLLSPVSPPDAALWHRAFILGLRDHGWVEGKNISIEYRYAQGRSERLPALAAELVHLNVELILASTTADALAASKATNAIPIVMATVANPVAVGLIGNLAKPGGNITGMSPIGQGLIGKRLELLKEAVPKLSRVAVLWNPEGDASKLGWGELQSAARQLGLELHSLEVRSDGDIDQAFDDAVRARAGALFIVANPVIVSNLKRIAQLAARKRLPAIYNLSEFADAGGLLAYGPDRADLFRRAATYVDKILKGAKPGELPVEQATRFELVVNRKTASALGINLPNSILVSADRVIE
jgi:putative ABC transport system substrate-binding protein